MAEGADTCKTNHLRIMTFRRAKHNHGMHKYEINNNVDVQATKHFYKNKVKKVLNIRNKKIGVRFHKKGIGRM
jgi:hypothetical protein